MWDLLRKGEGAQGELDKKKTEKEKREIANCVLLQWGADKWGRGAF